MRHVGRNLVNELPGASFLVGLAWLVSTIIAIKKLLWNDVRQVELIWLLEDQQISPRMSLSSIWRHVCCPGDKVKRHMDACS